MDYPKRSESFGEEDGKKRTGVLAGVKDRKEGSTRCATVPLSSKGAGMGRRKPRKE